MLALVLLLAVLALPLAGCQATSDASSAVESAPGLSSSLPVASSLPVSSEAESGPAPAAVPGEAPSEAATTAMVNWVLEAYRDGTLPEKIIYHSDAGVALQSPPKDTTLPEAVTEAELEFTVDEPAKYGWTTTARLVLPQDYALFVTVGEPVLYEGEWTDPMLLWVHFSDLLGISTAERVENPGGSPLVFTGLSADRTNAVADFEGLPLGAHGAFGGTVRWVKSGDFLWVDFDDGFFYTYRIGLDGALEQEYPTDQYRDLNPTPATDEEALAACRTLLQSFAAALDEAGLPAA